MHREMRLEEALYEENTDSGSSFSLCRKKKFSVDGFVLTGIGGRYKQR